MKSSPWSMNACTGDGGPLPSRSSSTARTLLEVVSGFCSEPESANSFSMIFCVSTNQLWSRPVAAQVAQRAERVEAGVERAGQPARRTRRTTATEGPGMIRIACIGQIGSQLRMPST